MAFDDLRYLYRDAFVRTIRDLRPALNVRSAALDKLDHELGHFDPHVVVSSQPSGQRAFRGPGSGLDHSLLCASTRHHDVWPQRTPVEEAPGRARRPGGVGC